jgi:hypothetical protein
LYDALVGTYEWIDIPVSPAADVLNTAHLDAQKDRAALLDAFIASVDQSTAMCHAKMTDWISHWVAQHKKTHPEIADILDEICLH